MAIFLVSTYLMFLILNFIIFNYFSNYIPYVNYFNDRDFIYNLGVVGGVMMLLLLTYSLRKRIKRFNVGHMRIWLNFHIALGILGPTLIFYHCKFSSQSMNSSIALYSMLFVFLSGFIGRYLYSFISSKHYFIKKEYTEELNALCYKLKKENYIAEYKSFLEIENSLNDYKSFFIIKKIIKLKSSLSYLDNSELKIEAQQYCSYLSQRFKLQNFEKLFSFWHILHIPLVFILFLTVLIHIYAVHIY